MDRATDSMLGELFEQLPDGCFFVLLDSPATHPPDSEALVDHVLTSARLLERVAAPAVIDLPESDSVRLSCSVGVVHFSGDGTELPELLDLADRRMYLAKGSGPDPAGNDVRPSMPV